MFAACAPGESATVSRSDALDAYALTLSGSNTLAGLSWGSPGDAKCPWVYRIRVDEDVPEQLSRVTRRPPEHSERLLVLGRAEGSAIAGPLSARALFSGRMGFFRARGDTRPLRREWFTSQTQIGPSSPDAACQERTWDPIEDAFALGWPRLTGRLTAVGERWVGTRVESRCNRLACYNPELNRGGIEAETPPCVSMAWEEQLVGVHALASGARVAVIESAWNDGHPEGVGVSSQRTAVVELATGRLLRAEVAIHHGILGVDRRLEIDAVDACAGGLAEAGWTRPRSLAPAVSEASAVFLRPSGRSAKKRASQDAPTISITPRAPTPASTPDEPAQKAPGPATPVITTPAPSAAQVEGAGSAPRQEQDNG